MDLYFSPLACSLATRISLYEAGAGAAARFLRVDTKARRVADGSGTDFGTINPLGQVPVLRTDAGDLITENAAILQHVAERLPEAGLAPVGGLARSRLQQWLSFIGTELHKAVFSMLFDPEIPEAAKAVVRRKAQPRLAVLDQHLRGRVFLLDGFSVADAYLVTVLNWCRVTAVSLDDYPALLGYYKRMLERPAVARAVAEERAIYAELHPEARLPPAPRA
jgi:glutathione S-transferase